MPDIWNGTVCAWTFCRSFFKEKKKQCSKRLVNKWPHLWNGKMSASIHHLVSRYIENVYRTVRATFFMFNVHLLDYILTEKFILQFCLHLNLNRIALHWYEIGKEKLFPSLLLSFVFKFMCMFGHVLCRIQSKPLKLNRNECSLHLLIPIFFPSEVDRSSTNNFLSLIQVLNGHGDEQRAVLNGLNRKMWNHW